MLFSNLRSLERIPLFFGTDIGFFTWSIGLNLGVDYAFSILISILRGPASTYFTY